MAGKYRASFFSITKFLRLGKPPRARGVNSPSLAPGRSSEVAPRLWSAGKWCEKPPCAECANTPDQAWSVKEKGSELAPNPGSLESTDNPLAAKAA